MFTFTSRLLLILFAVVSATGCASLERRVVPELHEIPDLQLSYEVQQASLLSSSLTVMTLNVAHGRRNGIHQFLQGAGRHRRNLDDISTVLRRERPHVVALQEADGPSLWSGGFSHVAYLAQFGGFAYHVRGEHDSFRGVSHGTAILSRLRLHDPLAVTFRRGTVAMQKGFVISTVAWPGRPGVRIDIVSVHLDVFNPRIRERQAVELMEVIESRDRPLVLMGDLNTVWNGRRRLLHKLTDEYGLTTYQPESREHATFALLGRRFDWIFVSPELSIRSYETLPDVLSDHRAVRAEILLRTVGPDGREWSSQHGSR